jgi:crotonobetainyl-CoA:carnitine CoA-transferase CaiB-like acyl-CoA transferase
MSTISAESPDTQEQLGPPLLDGLSVVELAEEIAGPFAARMFADAGADTIKIEPPQGDVSRRMAPFADPSPHRETSTSWLAYNTSKRSVVLDLDTASGRRLLQRLVANADVFVTDRTPARLAELDLSPEDLRERYPTLIIAAVTPFGLIGSAADWPSTALTRAHASGSAAGVRRNLGADTGAPLMAGAKVHEADGGMALALAMWSALIARERFGHGQIVDVASTEAMMNMDRVDISIAHNDGGPPARPPTKGGSAFGGRLECSDGHLIAVTPQSHQWAGLIKSMGDPEWAFDGDGNLVERLELGEEASEAIEEWAAAHTRDEVFRALQENSAPAGPVLRPSEVMDSEQMQVRDFFDRLEHPVAESARYPQFASRWNGAQRAARTAAPLLGSSTADIVRSHLTPWSPAQARRAGVI